MHTGLLARGGAREGRMVACRPPHTAQLTIGEASALACTRGAGRNGGAARLGLHGVEA